MIALLFSLLLSAGFQNPADLYQSAMEDMKAERWGEAIQKLEQVLKEDPAHVPTQFNLAVSLERAGNRDRAVETYRKLLDQDGSLFEARVNLGILLYESNALPAAEEQFLKAVELAPQSAEVHFWLGSYYLKMQKPDTGWEHLVKAEQLGLKKPSVYIALSDAERMRGHAVPARVYLERATELDPENKAALRQLGVMYRDSGQLSRAIEVFRKLEDSELELALLYFDNKNFIEAATAFEKLLQKEPGNADYWYMLGKSYQQRSQPARAIAALQKCLELNRDYADAYGTLAAVLYAQENWAMTVPVMRRFVELRPKNAFSHFVLATSYDKLGDLANAVLHYDKFLELDDGSNDARSFQARQRSRTLQRRLKR